MKYLLLIASVLVIGCDDSQIEKGSNDNPVYISDTTGVRFGIISRSDFEQPVISSRSAFAKAQKAAAGLPLCIHKGKHPIGLPNDTIPNKDNGWKWSSKGTWDSTISLSFTLGNPTVITPQYDTVDVICLATDTTRSGTVGGQTIYVMFSIKAKAVREKETYWGSPDPNADGSLNASIVPRHNWAIKKYIGIPSKYIIWQTKILK
jgi:hypothetical protein